jgi:hypothetical protein
MLAPCADGIGGTGRFQRLRTRLQQESVETLEHSQEQEAKKRPNGMLESVLRLGLQS